MLGTATHQLDDAAVETAADVMLLFAHPGRLKLLLAMQAAPHSTRGQLAEDIDLSPHQVTHLLRSLRAKNVVARRKTGRSMHYCIADPTVDAVLDTLRGCLEQDQDHALSA